MAADERQRSPQAFRGAALAVVGLLLLPFGEDSFDDLGIRRGSHGVARAADVERAGNGFAPAVGRAAEADMAALQVHAQAGEVGVRVAGKRTEVRARFVG